MVILNGHFGLTCSKFEILDVGNAKCFCGNITQFGTFEPCEKAINENKCCGVDARLVNHQSNIYACLPNRIIFDIDMPTPYDSLPIWRHEWFQDGQYRLWTFINASKLTLPLDNVPRSTFCVEFLSDNRWGIFEFQEKIPEYSYGKLFFIFICLVIVSIVLMNFMFNCRNKK